MTHPTTPVGSPARTAQLHAEGKLIDEEGRLLRQARELQRANFNLISIRHNPTAFGRNERELEKIWKALDAIRARRLGGAA